jgi:hypothetical protein
MSITSSSTGVNQTFVPVEPLYDPVNKFRTSTPQALIDTDFEYGTQVSKWENLGLVNNRPFTYASTQQIPNVQSMVWNAGSRLVTVTLATGVAPANGTPIYVQDALASPVNGNFIIESGGGTGVFYFSARSTNSTAFTAVFDTYKTSIFTGTAYTNAALPSGSYYVTLGTTNAKQVIVQTTLPHGLAIGNEIVVTGITGSNPPNGAFEVAGIPDPLTFVYYASATPSSLSFSSMNVYVRGQAQFLHRPFDGGVIFSANGNSNFETAIRQTRRYFRYQSGKGIQMSSGTILKPNLQIDSMTASALTPNNTVTVTTKERHNLQTGAQIQITGVTNDTGFNGTWTVSAITGYNTFQFVNSNGLTALTATGVFYVLVTGWYGAVSRLGLFDDQNGVFFEFDGTTLSVVRRNSTFQLPGRYSVSNGSNTVTKTTSSYPTYNLAELSVGDFVVIRGQSYRVQDIADNDNFTITPAYRGTNASHVQISLTRDLKIPQSSWNLDKMDGTGTSGYNIDLSKMQMFYIDYSWYGAGFIRWGFRANNGNVTYCHKLANNNVNTEAYMRSGNLPARYESRQYPPLTKLSSAVLVGDGVINCADNSTFPSSGTILVRNASQYEFMNYTGKNLTNTQFTGVTREKAGNVAGVVLTIGSGSNTGTVVSATGLQIGQRVYDLTTGYIPEGAWIQNISGTTITLNVAATGSNPTVVFAPMGFGQARSFAYTAGTAPTTIELAWPSYAPTISHWGTSVIMDGRFDDDKSLLFTYGQTAFTTLGPSGGVIATATMNATNTITVTNPLIVQGQTVTGTYINAGTVVVSNNGTTVTLNQAASGSGSASLTFSGVTTKALMSIRVAPSVDNGQIGPFGARELINRMQLVLRALDVTTRTASSNLLVTAVLNGVPTGATSWTNIVKGDTTVANSSLAQIADYAGGSTITTGGEVTGGFFLNQTSSIDLALVRDLGNAIMGGGISLTSNAGIYPDGPDVLTILVTNLAGGATADVVARLSWTEAQA